jgi:LuxR family transcriptional regulator, maltose regulon positive regulatory protein
MPGDATCGVDGAPEMETQGDDLSARERQVLELVDAGLRDEEMADRLGIARSTVSMLLRSSMAKLDARTRVEAASMARRQRLSR